MRSGEITFFFSDMSNYEQVCSFIKLKNSCLTQRESTYTFHSTENLNSQLQIFVCLLLPLQIVFYSPEKNKTQRAFVFKKKDCFGIIGTFLTT